jgi:hypothetical protein
MDRPVDNATYNLLQTLTSKLEAIEAYDKYARDADGELQGFFQECKRNDEQSVSRLMELLATRLSARQPVGTR